MKIKQIIIVSLAALIASFAIVKADTIYSLPQWLLYNGFLKPVVTSSTLQVPSLANSTANTCVSTNASGTFYLIPCGSGGGGSSTILYQGYGITLTPNPINTTGTVAVNTSTLTSYIATLGYLTSASGTAEFYPLSGNPSNFTTTTIQSVLNSLSAVGLATYNSSTGVFNVSSSILTPYLTIASATAIYYPLTNPSAYLAGVTASSPLSGSGTVGSPLIFTNPGYVTSSTGLTYFFPATSTVFQPALNGAYVSSFNGATGTVIGVNSVNGATGTVVFGYVATNTGNWAGTWQGNNSSSFALAASSSQWTTTSTGIFYNGGNVGIGLTNPAYALDMAAGDVYGYNGTVMAQASTTLFNYFLGGAGTIGAAATGIRNTGTGYQALSHLTTGGSNTANGYYSLYSNTTGNNNTANSDYSLYSNTTGGSNTANGDYSLYSNTTGNNNTANGYYSLYSNTTGNNNTANGDYSLYSNTTGNYNAANGYDSLYYNTTNIATLGAITGGSGYTPGTYTGVQMTLSSGSSAATYPIATIIASSTGAITSVVITTNGLGFKDTTTFLTAPTSSLGGTGSGFKVAVASLSTGQNNTADGYQAGRFISGGVGLNENSTYSTYIGYNAYPLASDDTNETVIGNGAVGSGSNTVTLGGTGTTGTIIPYGNVGIGTTTPNSTLQVNGNISLTSSSTVSITVPTGALLAGACDSATSSIDSTVTTSTAKFAIAPLVDAGDQYYYKAFISAPSVLTAKVCAITAGTPATTTLNIGIFK